MNETRTAAIGTAPNLDLNLAPLRLPLSHRQAPRSDRVRSDGRYVEADVLSLNIARACAHRPVYFTAVSSVAATFDRRLNSHVRDRGERAETEPVRILR